MSTQAQVNASFIKAVKNNNIGDAQWYLYSDSNHTLENHADINARDENRVTALMWAVDGKNFGMVKYLIDRGADVNAFCKEHTTPLLIATQGDFGGKGYEKIARLLMAHGADPYIKDINGVSPASYVGKMKNLPEQKRWLSLLKILDTKVKENIVRLPMKRRVIKEDTQDRNLTWELHKAVRYNQLDNVKKALADGADIDASMSDEMTPLMWACYLGYTGIAIYLIDEGAKLNRRNSGKGTTALMMSSWEGDEEITKYLIDNSADIDMVDKNGWNALMYGAYRGKKDNVKLLLNAGINPNLKNNEGKTAIDLAKEYHYGMVVKELRKKGGKEGKQLIESLIIESLIIESAEVKPRVITVELDEKDVGIWGKHNISSEYSNLEIEPYAMGKIEKRYNITDANDVKIVYAKLDKQAHIWDIALEITRKEITKTTKKKYIPIIFVQNDSEVDEWDKRLKGELFTYAKPEKIVKMVLDDGYEPQDYDARNEPSYGTDDKLDYVELNGETFILSRNSRLGYFGVELVEEQ